MKAVYGKLKVPNVPTGHIWTVEKLKKNAAAGDLYVRAKLPLINASLRDGASREKVSTVTYGFTVS